MDVAKLNIAEKTILIISPNAWGNMFVSKHHYAVELARQGNRVYFLNPPEPSLQQSVVLQPVEQHRNITLVRYRPLFSFRVRFHARWLFNKLMIWQIWRLQHRLQTRFDVVWCFDQNLFANLTQFRTRYTIYHPVDPLPFDYQLQPARTCNMVLSVSDKIISRFDSFAVRKYVLNHGLSNDFAQQALSSIQNNTFDTKHDNVVRVGYVGNLLRPIINHGVIKTIIEAHPNVEFHFWGPSALEQSNLSGDNSPLVRGFVTFLQQQPNVRLHGVTPSAQLYGQIKNMDMFLLVYAPDMNLSDRSNSHKLIEYLSTGKTIVCNRFDMYAHMPDMLQMPDSDNDMLIPALFDNVLQNLAHYNSPDLQKKRIEYALQNTYNNHIAQIWKWMEEKNM